MNEPLHFFLPFDYHTTLPRNIRDYWEWQISEPSLSSLWGQYHWVLQTYLYFKQYDIPCLLVDEIPNRGIIITHRDLLPSNIPPTKDRYLICMLVDRDNPHPYANLHILHNPIERLKFHRNFIYIPPWPQVSLIPRNPDRGELCKTIGYFGYPSNLAIELRSTAFLDTLKSIGFDLDMPTPNDWNDYQNIDLLIGIRRFGNKSPFETKPSLKLYNAWLAEIPIILGYESAYRVEGSPGKDYIESITLDETLTNIQRLKEEPKLRKSIVLNGKNKIQAYLPDATINRWNLVLKNSIIPSYHKLHKGRWGLCRQRIVGRVREGLTWRTKSTFAGKHPHL